MSLDKLSPDPRIPWQHRFVRGTTVEIALFNRLTIWRSSPVPTGGGGHGIAMGGPHFEPDASLRWLRPAETNLVAAGLSQALPLK